MKLHKIFLTLALLLMSFSVYSQSFFINDTCGTVYKKITYLQTDSTSITSKHYCTITGTASVEITFSFSNNSGATSTSIQFAANTPILLSSIDLTNPPFLTNASKQIWFKLTSAGNVDLQVRAW